MSEKNNDMQASFELIQLIENSKQNSEKVIETLPDIFLIIDSSGKVYKANAEASLLLNISSEQILGFSFSSILKQETWNLFQSKFNQIINDLNQVVFFELPIYLNGVERIMFWSLNYFGDFCDSKLRLFTIHGRDITLLRLYQKKINDIFATIPIAILTVNSAGIIDETYSEYSKWIFGRNDIGGKKLSELIYDPIKETIDDQQREDFKALLASTNISLIEFDVLSQMFPRQFFYPLNDSIDELKGRYLGIKVQSITLGDRVVGLLCLFEDRTLIVEAEKTDAKLNFLRNQSIERAIQLKSLDPELLEIALNDLSRLFHELGDKILTQDTSGFENIIHSIKSNARVAGFTNLEKITHSFESRLREHTEFSWGVVFSNFENLQNEWREILSLKKVFSGSNMEPEKKSNFCGLSKSVWNLYVNALKNPNSKAEFESYLKGISKAPLSQLENSLRNAVQKTCDITHKKATLHFDWNRDLEVDIDIISQIRTCLFHILNNAIDHGIEMPDERIKKQKQPIGNIRLGSIHSPNEINIYVEDDGSGLNRNKILEKAISKGIVSQTQAEKLTDSEIFDFLFSEQFSTASVVTELSGRGVGLSAVREICRKLNGDAKVTIKENGYTRFNLQLSLKEQSYVK